MDSGVAFCNPLIPVPARNQPIRHLASSLYNFRLVIQSTLLKSPEKFWNSTFHISGLFSGGNTSATSSSSPDGLEAKRQRVVLVRQDVEDVG